MYGYAPEMLARLARLAQDTRLVRVRTTLEGDTFLVHRMRGHEAVSRPFAFSAELLSPDAMLELKQVVGQPITVSLSTPRGDRHFHGYVREFARTGTDGGLASYRAEIAPWFAFLEFTSNCRIFQDLSVPDIVAEVFAAYDGLALCEYRLGARYEKIPYCVQYNESDFAFVSRLLEDAGIHYYFAHAEDRHTMVLRDDSTQAPEIDGYTHVSYVADTQVQNEHGIEAWKPRRRVGPSVQARKSFDFKQPRSPLTVDQPMAVPRGILPRLETFMYEGAARYGDSRIGEALAGMRAEEAAWQTKLFEADGNHPGLQSGRNFLFHGHYEHAEADEDERRFLVLEASHDLRNNFGDGYNTAEPATHRVTAVCLRRKIPFRPQRLTPQPRMAGPQTATVVGPPGEEIHADRYGRVKVQFHWDRFGTFNHSSSCWVRVASPWAGSGMGGVSAPRIGQEVVVDFLDGDPDRPLITGRVYNEDNMPPFGLEVSGMKSRTVKGEGYNEVTMHDSAGSELLNMHAQRDMVTTVLNDQNAAVKNNKSTDVTNNHTMSVGVDQTISVGGKRGISVTGDDSLSITGARTTTVDKAVTETYKLGQTLTIPAVGYTETITGPLLSTLTGAYTSVRTGAWMETVTGTSTRSVSALTSETLTGGRTVTVSGGSDTRSVTGSVVDTNTGARTVTTTGNVELGATGTFASFSDGEMSVGSGSKVMLGVGESGIEITGGVITIVAGGAQVKIDASGVTVNGARINLN